MKKKKPIRDLTQRVCSGTSKEAKEEDRIFKEAEKGFMRALQHLARISGHDPLCHLCLRATAENEIVWWNAKRLVRSKKKKGE